MLKMAQVELSNAFSMDIFKSRKAKSRTNF